MSIQVSYLSLFEIGHRSNQEDCIYPKINGSLKNNDLFIICDGMGGHDDGEVASQTVCNTLSSYILTRPEADLDSALNAAYNALDKRDYNGEGEMGTTLALVKFEESHCIVAHIGDSRVYQIRPSEKKLVFVTKDHSLINSLIECGELSPEEAKSFPQKNVITRAMQPNQENRAKADVAVLTDIREGDYFYMCSDGMLENIDDEEIINIISKTISDREKMSVLKNLTKDNKDNHSAHLIRVISNNKNSFATNAAKTPILKKYVWILLAVAVILGILCIITKRPTKMTIKTNELDSTSIVNSSNPN